LEKVKRPNPNWPFSPKIMGEFKITPTLLGKNHLEKKDPRN